MTLLPALPLAALALAAVSDAPAVVPPPPPPETIALQSGRRITLEDALHLVATSHPRLAAGQADLSATDYTRKAARGAMLPAVAVGDMLNYSDAKIRLKAAGGAAPTGPSVFSQFPAELGVNVFYATVRQPLSGLLPLSYDYKSAHAQMAADAETLAYERSTLETDVRTQFAQLFRAGALIDTARESERSLADQAGRSRAQLSAGAATQTDVLRIDAALASARQQRVAAEANEISVRAYLLEMLGLAEEGDSIEFVVPHQFVEEDALTPNQLLRQTALQRRADLSAQIHAAEGLRLAARARLFDLLPKVDVSLSYINMFGRPTAKDSTQVHGNVLVAGLSASWPIWTWGAQLDTHKAARARAQAARSRLEERRRMIGAEVKSRHAAVIASDSGVALAQAQVAAAEEAYRVMVATLAADAATTTDLLAAEAAQTQARNALVDARFSVIIARLALQHALGSSALPRSGHSAAHTEAAAP